VKADCLRARQTSRTDNSFSQGGPWLERRFFSAQTLDPFDNAHNLREESKIMLSVCGPEVTAAIVVAHGSSQSPCEKCELLL
jgi:hypothetical protein